MSSNSGLRNILVGAIHALRGVVQLLESIVGTMETIPEHDSQTNSMSNAPGDPPQAYCSDDETHISCTPEHQTPKNVDHLSLEEGLMGSAKAPSKSLESSQMDRPTLKRGRYY